MRDISYLFQWGDIAALVEGVEDTGVRGRRVARNEAVHPEGVDGLDVAAAIEFGDGVRAFVEMISSLLRRLDGYRFGGGNGPFGAGGQILSSDKVSTKGEDGWCVRPTILLHKMPPRHPNPPPITTGKSRACLK